MSKEFELKRRAYLLMEVDPGKEEMVIRPLRKLENIIHIDFIHGDYDFLCILEGKFVDIQRTIIEARKIPHIRKTTTLIAFDTSLTEWEKWHLEHG